MSTKRSRKKKATPASLLSPTSMGGIIGGGGFDFQTRYAACHLPLWLCEGSFHQFFFEGTGDIDIRYVKSGTSSRDHIQVKDHEVSGNELKSAIEQFQALDSSLRGIYRKFILACPSLPAALRPIESGLARLRGAKPFYDDVPQALDATKQELENRFRKKGLGHLLPFIEEKVFIEIGHGDLCHDDRAIELFIARLLTHPEYSGKVRAMVQPAFSELMRAIMANKGTVLERTDIEGILRSAVAAGIVGEKSLTLWVHNWTKEVFEPSADFTLDWTSHFDRASRRVPSQEVWNGTLLPELLSVRQTILAERTERIVRFRGKCALSTGIALGSIFPSVGGWVFEIPQPPAKDHWRSDAPPTAPYDVRVEIVDGSLSATDLVLALNIRGDGRGDVMRYVEGTGSPPRLFAFVSPPSQGAQSIGDAADACAFSLAVRDQLGQLLKAHRLSRARLFFYGPFALAVFLGQQLTSVGEIQLFEYQDPGYVSSFSLRT